MKRVAEKRKEKEKNQKAKFVHSRKLLGGVWWGVGVGVAGRKDQKKLVRGKGFT